MTKESNNLSLAIPLTPDQHRNATGAQDVRAVAASRDLEGPERHPPVREARRDPRSRRVPRHGRHVPAGAPVGREAQRAVLGEERRAAVVEVPADTFAVDDGQDATRPVAQGHADVAGALVVTRVEDEYVVVGIARSAELVDSSIVQLGERSGGVLAERPPLVPSHRRLVAAVSVSV